MTAPSDRTTRFAQTVSEAVNCLGIALCGPALRKFGPDDVDELLGRWEADYASTLREVRLGRVSLRPAVESLTAAIRARGDLAAPGDLAALRLAIREFLATLGAPLPSLPPEEAAVCELHGRACPVLTQAPPPGA